MINVHDRLIGLAEWDQQVEPVRLAGTSGDAVFKISWAGRPAVIRFRGNRDACARELEAQRQAFVAGVAPQVLKANLDDGYFVSDFAVGESPGVAALRLGDSSLERIGERLRALHTGECRLDPIDLAVVGHSYVQQVEESRHAVAAVEFVSLKKKLAAVRRHEYVLCHNDLVRENIILGDSVQFIDWSFAQGNDAFFDLAVVAGHHQLDKHACSVLLRGYGGDSELERLAAWCEIYDHVHWLWLMARRDYAAARQLRPDIVI